MRSSVDGFGERQPFWRAEIPGIDLVANERARPREGRLFRAAQVIDDQAFTERLPHAAFEPADDRMENFLASASGDHAGA